MAKRILLVCLALTALPSLATAAPVDVVTPESAGISSERLGALKERLQKVLQEKRTLSSSC